jgi:hypothetical protein
MTKDLLNSYRTHFNYIECLSKITKNLKIISIYSLNKNDNFIKNESFKRKLRLINTIKKTIDLEKLYVEEKKGMSFLSSFWISTKTYYLLFHMSCIAGVLINADLNCLNYEHRTLHKVIKKRIFSENLKFNNSHFNQVYTYDEIKNLKREAGYNLKIIYEEDDMINFILNLIIKYEKEFIKRKDKFNDFRTKKGKKSFKKLKEKQYSLFDILYSYRIKTNYSDLDFLNAEIDIDDYYSFYMNYYLLMNNLYIALKDFINYLSNQRFGKNLI